MYPSFYIHTHTPKFRHRQDLSSHKKTFNFKNKQWKHNLGMHEGHMLHCKDSSLEENLPVLVEKWQEKQSARRLRTQEAAAVRVRLWFTATHMFGSFCLAKCKSWNAKQYLKKSGNKTKTALWSSLFLQE